jgi:hypothetical protein
MDDRLVKRWAAKKRLIVRAGLGAHTAPSPGPCLSRPPRVRAASADDDVTLELKDITLRVGADVHIHHHR